MPVTQDRMIALIKAARAYQVAALQMEKIISSNMRTVLEKRATPADALQLISQNCLLYLIMQDNNEADKTITLEEYHFSKNFARNQNAAARNRKSRGTTTKTNPNTTAPKFLVAKPDKFYATEFETRPATPEFKGLTSEAKARLDIEAEQSAKQEIRRQAFEAGITDSKRIAEFAKLTEEQKADFKGEGDPLGDNAPF